MSAAVTLQSADSVPRAPSHRSRDFLSVSQVHSYQWNCNQQDWSWSGKHSTHSSDGSTCNFCRKSFHPHSTCSAKDHKCSACQKHSHNSRVCYSQACRVDSAEAVEVGVSSPPTAELEVFVDLELLLIGALDSPTWKTDVTLLAARVTFNIDTGVDVSLLSQSVL